ncbi:MAG: phosphoglycolate phosphatase [Xanthobacteraceae bacterium]
MLTIVFDLDGTLIDTAPDLVDTLNVILHGEGLPAVDFAIARNLIGGGARLMIERALAAENRTCTAAEMERLYAAFIAHYATHIADRSRPFPHVTTTLAQLAASGHRLAVCTNKLEGLAKSLLGALHLVECFSAVCGQDTFRVQKPDPDMLRFTVRRAGGEPAQAIMIGDSRTDIHTARAAAVPVIAVDFGYSDVPITTLLPDRTISSFKELPAAIAGLMAAPA